MKEETKFKNDRINSSNLDLQECIRHKIQKVKIKSCYIKETGKNLLLEFNLDDAHIYIEANNKNDTLIFEEKSTGGKYEDWFNKIKLMMAKRIIKYLEKNGK